MPGPAPSKDPVRRNSRVGPLVLPAAGRTGPPPPWPLHNVDFDIVTPLEEQAWAYLWATPQAVAWERLGAGIVRTVARYCRLMVAAEFRDVDTGLLAAVTALEDRLGMTPKAMRMLLWEVAPDDVSEHRKPRPVGDIRKRLRAVD